MARKHVGKGDEDTLPEGLSDNLDRICRLLALIAVKGEPQEQKILTLSAAGFSPAEIAPLLATTRNTVSVTLSKSRGKRKRKPKRD